MGIFDKVLKKTKEGWFKKVTTLFERTTTADVLSDDLEELLIAADVGVGTATKLIDQVKARTKSEKLSANSQIYSALKNDMQQYKNYAPALLAAGVFSVLMLAVSLISWVPLFIMWLVFLILLRLKMIKKKAHPVEVTRLSIE